MRSRLKVVWFTSGDGKTHYIKKQLQRSSSSVTISVNEAFTPVGAIQKLRRLPPNQENCAVFFNFTMIPPGVSSKLCMFINPRRTCAARVIVVGLTVCLSVCLSVCVDAYSGNTGYEAPY